MDHIRRQRWRSFFGLEAASERADAETPETLMESNERIQQVKAAIRNLPPNMREVLVLSAYGELTYQEIPGVLRIPIGTVMSRLARARAALQKEIAG